MALTKRQKINLYSVLEVPYSSSVTIPQGQFNIHSVEYKQADDVNKTQTRIEARLTELDAEEEAILVELVNKWELLSTNTVTISGDVGSLRGVDFDPAQQLTRVKSRILILVPVFQFLNQIKNESISMPLSIMGTR